MTADTHRSNANTIALWVLAILAAIAFLRLARALLIPIAVAVLVSYALEPVVAWLHRRRVPRPAGAALVMLGILGLAVWGGYRLKDDARQLVQAAPKAVEELRQRVISQLGSAGTAALSLGAEGTSGGSQGSAIPTGRSGEVPASLVQRIGSSLFEIGGQMVAVFFLTLFLLISGQQIRSRFVEIAGPDPERRRLTASVIRDINAQIERYLLVLLVTGAIVGMLTWGVLAWMGIRHAAIWGLFAGVFNAIPYFGPVIICGGLFLVGLLEGGGVTKGLQAAGAALAITSVEGWVITPPLMGKAEHMNALAVLLGLLLWTWIWGVWGTILAVPMLVVIKSVADHVDRLRPLGRLLAP